MTLLAVLTVAVAAAGFLTAVLTDLADPPRPRPGRTRRH